ncbi:MAG: AAA family ATPase, partial [Chitinophagales bacterium]
MANIGDNNESNNDGKKSKFNIYWIYGIVLLSIIAINVIPMGNNVKEISDAVFFQQYLPTHDVDKLLVVNDREVEVFIKADRLS